MRAVVLRVNSASVVVPEEGERPHASIATGLLVLAGLEARDGRADLEWMARKIAGLRVFPDDHDRMNLAVDEVNGEVLLVPNFTVAGDARKGRRPSYDNAMDPARAEGEFERFAELVRAEGVRVHTGVFRAHMHVASVNDGPVTICLDSRA